MKKDNVVQEKFINLEFNAKTFTIDSLPKSDVGDVTIKNQSNSNNAIFDGLDLATENESPTAVVTSKMQQKESIETTTIANNNKQDKHCCCPVNGDSPVWGCNNAMNDNSKCDYGICNACKIGMEEDLKKMVGVGSRAST